MRRGTRIGSIIIGALATLFLITGEGLADWHLYASGGLGISAAEVDTDGQAGTLPTVGLSGMDNDSSPLLAGAIGFSIPMDELVPREWLPDMRLPSWRIRHEFEAAGLREYEFSTIAGGEAYFSRLETTTFFWNNSLDIPLGAAYKPIQYILGLGRQPRVRRWLEPASFYVLTGVGLQMTTFDGTSNVIGGDDDILDFAWNAGAGASYALTDRVSLAAGYRYVGLSKQTIDLGGPFTPGANDEVDYDPHIHEFRVDVRVLFFDFRGPWR